MSGADDVIPFFDRPPVRAMSWVGVALFGLLMYGIVFWEQVRPLFVWPK